MLPPMVVYKSTTGVVYQSWCEGGPDGTAYAATKNGWFNMDKFNQWFKQAGIYLLIQYRYGTITYPYLPALLFATGSATGTGTVLVE